MDLSIVDMESSVVSASVENAYMVYLSSKKENRDLLDCVSI